jgi:DNA-binding response OmpR family regulator
VTMSTNSLKVLVVDDERTIADTLAVILRKSGFQAYPAYSGQEAIRLSLQVKPDLMISDVMMPDKNGIDVAAEVQALVPSCRVLFFSGHCATATLLLNAKQPGKGWDILPKPVHPHDLLVRVHGLVAEDVPYADPDIQPSAAAPDPLSSGGKGEEAGCRP